MLVKKFYCGNIDSVPFFLGESLFFEYTRGAGELGFLPILSATAIGGVLLLLCAIHCAHCCCSLLLQLLVLLRQVEFHEDGMAITRTRHDDGEQPLQGRLGEA